MKKNRNGSFSYSGKLSKVLLRMKLTFVLLLCVMIPGVRFSECTNSQFEKTKCFSGRNSLGIEREDTAGVYV